MRDSWPVRLFGQWPVAYWGAPFVVVLSDERHRPLWEGLAYVVWVVVFPLAAGVRSRVVPAPPSGEFRAGVRGAVRGVLTRAPRVTALVWAVLIAWYSHHHYDRPWLAVLTGVATFAAAIAGLRQAMAEPIVRPPSPPSPTSTTTVSPSWIAPDSNPFASPSPTAVATRRRRGRAPYTGS
jgi:hypothetical protein